MSDAPLRKCLFIGGAVDGQWIETRGEPHQSFATISPGLKRADGNDIHHEIRESRYRCEKLGAMGRVFFVYLQEDLSTYDGLSLLIENYNPRPSE